MGYDELPTLMLTESGIRKNVSSCEMNLIPKEPHPNKVMFKLLEHSEVDFDSWYP